MANGAYRVSDPQKYVHDEKYCSMARRGGSRNPSLACVMFYAWYHIQCLNNFEAVEILLLSVILYLLVTPVAATVCQEIHKPMHILIKSVFLCVASNSSLPPRNHSRCRRGCHGMFEQGLRISQPVPAINSWRTQISRGIFGKSFPDCLTGAPLPSPPHPMFLTELLAGLTQHQDTSVYCAWRKCSQLRAGSPPHLHDGYALEDETLTASSLWGILRFF